MDIKAAKTVAMVVIAFLVCYLPVVVTAGRDHEYSDSVTWPGLSSYLTSVFLFQGESTQ